MEVVYYDNLIRLSIDDNYRSTNDKVLMVEDRYNSFVMQFQYADFNGIIDMLEYLDRHSPSGRNPSLAYWQGLPVSFGITRKHYYGNCIRKDRIQLIIEKMLTNFGIEREPFDKLAFVKRVTKLKRIGCIKNKLKKMRLNQLENIKAIICEGA